MLASRARSAASLPNRPALLYRISALVLATLLINLHLYRYDLTLVALAMALSAHAHRLRFGGYGAWPAVAAVFWVINFWSQELLLNEGINLQTPMIALLLVVNVREGRRTASAVEPASVTGAIRARCRLNLG